MLRLGQASRPPEPRRAVPRRGGGEVREGGGEGEGGQCRPRSGQTAGWLVTLEARKRKERELWHGIE